MSAPILLTLTDGTKLLVAMPFRAVGLDYEFSPSYFAYGGFEYYRERHSHGMKRLVGSSHEAILTPEEWKTATNRYVASPDGAKALKEFNTNKARTRLIFGATSTEDYDIEEVRETVYQIMEKM